MVTSSSAPHPQRRGRHLPDVHHYPEFDHVSSQAEPDGPQRQPVRAGIAFPERDRQNYDFVEAQPAPLRSGRRYFEEQTLWRDPAISGSHVGGASSDQQDQYVYEYKVADGRGRLGCR